MVKKILFEKKSIIFILLLFVIFITIYACDRSMIVEITDEDIAMAGGITPMMFGAKGDGKTNDSKAVQTAIDYVAKSKKHTVVFIPEGIYSVKNIRLRKNVSLMGEGENSILLADPSSKTWNAILYCKDLDDVSIKKITFDGNKPIVPGDDQKGTANMWVISCSNLCIEDCTFQNNWYIGVCLKESKDIAIENNRFLNLDCGVLTAAKPSHNILVKGNFFDGAEYSEPVSIFGLEAGYHTNITIIDNEIKNHTKGNGILLRAVKSVTVKNNKIDNCATGIYCSSVKYEDHEYGVYDAIIEGNTITNSVYEGILLDNLNHSKIENNTIEDSGTFGLMVKYVNYSLITKNIILKSNITGKEPYHGFPITIKGMVNSTVSYNSINIQRIPIERERSLIYIGGENISSNDNEFIENETSVHVDSLYKQDLRYAKNNIFAYK